MPIEALAAEVTAALAASADPRYRAQIERLVPGIRTIGVKVPAIRAAARSFAAPPRALAFDDACSLLDRFAAARDRDRMLFGVFLVAHYRREVVSLPWPRIERWAKAVDNWETCDQLGMEIVAARVAAANARVDRLLAWTKAKDVWRRRLALAAATALNQKGRANPAATLTVCAALAADREPMVCKALAWALREATKNDAAAVAAFLGRHGPRMHPSAVREGSAKLAPATRRRLLARIGSL
jgi:3-methyladenine DNA glycosylase AlkD